MSTFGSWLALTGLARVHWPKFPESCGPQCSSEPTVLGSPRVPRRRVIPRENQAHVRRQPRYRGRGLTRMI
jgi:hypothetical protein